MRICLISREFPPDTGWGGIGTVMFHLGNGLTRLGHDVHVIALKGNLPGANNGNGASLPKDSVGPTVHRVAPTKLAPPDGLFNFCLPVTRPMLDETSALWSKFLELRNEKPFDAIEVPEHFAEGLFPALSRVAPLIVRLHTPHSKLVKERFHNFEPTFDHRVLTVMERVTMVSADALVSPSEDLAAYVANDLNIPLDRISIIRNPVDEKRFTPEGETIVREDGTTRILFVGRLEARKGVHDLVKAIPKVVAKCANARFVLIGSDTNKGVGNSSVLAELKALLQEHHCESVVSFISHVPLADLPKHYRAADICVLPSLYENAPMTAIEAMSCGKPVVASSAGGTKEYVIDNECGRIVPTGDSEALADALIQLIEDSELRTRFGQAARQRVVEKLTVDKMCSDTVALYERAAATFARRATPNLYTGNAESLQNDLTDLVASLEKRLYEMVFSYSLRFRLKHWQKKARTLLTGKSH